MNDIFQPLPFPGNGPDPATKRPAEAEASPVRRKRRHAAKKAQKALAKRRGRPAKAQSPTVVEPKPAQVGKTPVRLRKARTIKVDLDKALDAIAGLSKDDAKFLTGVLMSMQPFSKQSRIRIVGALGKMVV